MDRRTLCGRHLTSFALLALATTSALACGPRENPYELKKESRNINELKQKPREMSAEELKAAREKAGFKSNEDIAAENAKMFEKGAREWVKTRMKEYRGFNKELRGHLDTLEKQAPKWASAKDPTKAFEKFRDKYKEEVKEFTKGYDEMTGHGAEGGETQAILGKAFRTFEDLNSGLGPEVANDERFAQMLTEIRSTLDEVDKALDDIEQDESLVVNKFHDDKKKKDDK